MSIIVRKMNQIIPTDIMRFILFFNGLSSFKKIQLYTLFTLSYSHEIMRLLKQKSLELIVL